MWRITWRLVVIFISGYLLIEWFPIEKPFRLGDFLIRPIINPLEFFAASVAFLVGLIISAQLFRNISGQIIITVKQKHKWFIHSYFAIVGLGFVYFFLFQNGWIQTSFLFSFSILYGMISVKH